MDTSVERSITEFENILANAPKSLLVTANLLGELFQTNVNVPKYIELRNKLEESVIQFRDQLLPSSEDLCVEIKNFFEIFNVLTYDEWKGDLSAWQKDILTLKEKSKSLYSSLTILGSEVRKITPASISLQNKLTIEKKEALICYEDYSQHSDNLFTAAPLVSLVPLIGWIVGPILFAVGIDVGKKAKQKLLQAQESEKAVSMIEDCLLDAIKNFADSIFLIAGFFNYLENELKSIHKHSESNIKIKFKIIKSKSGNVMSKCDIFVALVPYIKNAYDGIV